MPIAAVQNDGLIVAIMLEEDRKATTDPLWPFYASVVRTAPYLATFS